VRASAPASRAEWREAYDASPDATFFHGPGWADLWERYTDGRTRAAPRRVELGDGSRAVLAILREPTAVPLLERDVVSAAGNVGGWVSADALDERHARALAAELLRAPALIWRRGPSDPLACALRIPGARTESTHVIDLRGGADAALARWRPAARRELGRASRGGATVREGTGPEDWRAYEEVYRASVARWERPSTVYDRRLFDVLATADDPEVRLFLAEAAGEAVAGAVVFTHRRHAVYWHGASAPARCAGASNLVQAAVVEILAAEGVATYDLNGSGPHAGVAQFKESIGGRRAAVYALHRAHALERAGSWSKRLLVGRGAASTARAAGGRGA
jgi:hypothetical protein